MLLLLLLLRDQVTWSKAQRQPRNPNSTTLAPSLQHHRQVSCQVAKFWQHTDPSIFSPPKINHLHLAIHPVNPSSIIDHVAYLYQAKEDQLLARPQTGSCVH